MLTAGNLGIMLRNREAYVFVAMPIDHLRDFPFTIYGNRASKREPHLREENLEYKSETWKIRLTPISVQ